MQAAFPPVEKLTLTPHDDLQVYRYGDLVWTTITQSIEALGKDGSQLRMIQRQTSIWNYQDECDTLTNQVVRSMAICSKVMILLTSCTAWNLKCNLFCHGSRPTIIENALANPRRVMEATQASAR